MGSIWRQPAQLASTEFARLPCKPVIPPARKSESILESTVRKVRGHAPRARGRGSTRCPKPQDRRIRRRRKKPDRNDPAKFGWKCLKGKPPEGNTHGRQWEEERAQEMPDIWRCLREKQERVRIVLFRATTESRPMRRSGLGTTLSRVRNMASARRHKTKKPDRDDPAKFGWKCQ